MPPQHLRCVKYTAPTAAIISRTELVCGAVVGVVAGFRCLGRLAGAQHVCRLREGAAGPRLHTQLTSPTVKFHASYRSPGFTENASSHVAEDSPPRIPVECEVNWAAWWRRPSTQSL